MALYAIILVQTVILGGAIALLWRRLGRLEAELARTRARLIAYVGARRPALAKRKRAALAHAYGADALGEFRAPPADDRYDDLYGGGDDIEAERRSARLWPMSELDRGQGPRAAPEMLRAGLAALLIFAPVGLLAFGASLAIAIVAAAGAILAAFALSLREAWAPAAWIGAVGAAGAGGAGLYVDVAARAPQTFAAALAITGVAGLVHARARMRRGPGLAPGLALFATAAAGALAGGALAGPIGLALASLVVAGAIAGAATTRLEVAHVGAFLAACGGLFVLSGSPEADTWLTPASTLTAALFIGVAGVSVPAAGKKAFLSAVTASAAGLIGAGLQASPNGLGAPLWAAGAFVSVSASLFAILAVAKQRKGALAPLGWSAWTLCLAGFASLAIAVDLAFAGPYASALFAAMALAFMLVDARAPHAMWRVCAVLATGAALWTAVEASLVFFSGRPGPAPALVVGLGAAAPALFAMLSARIAWPRAPLAGAIFEAAALFSASLAASVALRAMFSGSASALAPLSHAEAGLHGALWLMAGLGCGAMMDREPRALRKGACALFTIAGASAAVLGAGIVLNPWWGGAHGAVTGGVFINSLALAYGAPAAAAWAHWTFWRGRGALRRGRAALVLVCTLTALWLALEIRRAFAGPNLFGPNLFGPNLVGAAIDWREACLYGLVVLGALVGGALLSRSASTRRRYR